MYIKRHQETEKLLFLAASAAAPIKRRRASVAVERLAQHQEFATADHHIVEVAQHVGLQETAPEQIEMERADNEEPVGARGENHGQASIAIEHLSQPPEIAPPENYVGSQIIASDQMEMERADNEEPLGARGDGGNQAPIAIEHPEIAPPENRMANIAPLFDEARDDLMDDLAQGNLSDYSEYMTDDEDMENENQNSSSQTESLFVPTVNDAKQRMLPLDGTRGADGELGFYDENEEMPAEPLIMDEASMDIQRPPNQI